ncbi:MAG: GNAT family N-acetyltransferase [Phycisphaerales bacterium]|nr:GNAT family N-acetyltransferase [Phycisphaerales bacterium]
MRRLLTGSDRSDSCKQACAQIGDVRAVARLSRRAVPNIDPDRFLLIALQRGEQPYVGKVHRNDQIVGGILARRTERRIAVQCGYWTVRSPKLRCLDVVYGGLVAEEQSDVAISMIRAELDSGRIECVTISNLAVDHQLFSRLASISAFRSPANPHWRYRLEYRPDTGVLGSFSKKHRYNVRRLDRILKERCRGAVELSEFRSPGDVAAFCEAAARITGRTYQAGLGVGFKNDALTRELLDLEAARERFRGYLLMCDGTPIAHQVGVVYGDTFFLEATSFDPAWREFSPGQVLLVRVLEDLCAQGVKWVDYGFGDAEYKRTYGSECWNEVSLRLYGRTTRARAAAAMERVVAVPALVGRSVLSSAMLGRMKRFWRRRFERDGAASERVG